jgi:hypothetical protein
MRFLAVLAVLGALALGGCGGEGDAGTTASSETTTGAPTTTAPEPKPKAHTGSAPKRTTPTNAPGDPGDPTPGEKAPAPGVPVTPQGDNSIQTFGEEGQDSERQQAEGNLRSYLAARARGDWAGACNAASRQFSEELEKLIEGAKAKQGAEKPEGCAETLELLYGKTPASAFQKAAQVDQVLSFRVRDDGYAYLIFESAGEIKFIAMANEGGAWKVNVPEPASFQASQGEAQ